MVNATVILNKTAQVRKRLDRLQTKKSLTREELKNNIDAQDIILHNLQLAIQGCVDIGTHIIADEGWGTVGSFSEIFYFLQEKKVLSPDLADRMVAMVGFRNLLVHEYETISMDIVYDILQTHLNDIEEFLLSVIDRFKL